MIVTLVEESLCVFVIDVCSLYRSATIFSLLSTRDLSFITLLNGRRGSILVPNRGTQKLRFYRLPRMNYRKLLASVSCFCTRCCKKKLKILNARS